MDWSIVSKAAERSRNVRIETSSESEARSKSCTRRSLCYGAQSIPAVVALGVSSGFGLQPVIKSWSPSPRTEQPRCQLPASTALSSRQPACAPTDAATLEETQHPHEKAGYGCCHGNGPRITKLQVESLFVSGSNSLPTPALLPF